MYAISLGHVWLSSIVCALNLVPVGTNAVRYIIKPSLRQSLTLGEVGFLFRHMVPNGWLPIHGSIMQLWSKPLQCSEC